MAKKKTAKKKVVKSVGWYIDQHLKLKRKKKKLNDQLRAVKAEMSDLEEEAVRKFSSDTILGARGRLGTGYIQENSHYNVSDRRKLGNFVIKHKLTELFQNRVSKDAVLEVLESHPRLKPKSLGLTVYEESVFRTRDRSGSED